MVGLSLLSILAVGVVAVASLGIAAGCGNDDGADADPVPSSSTGSF